MVLGYAVLRIAIAVALGLLGRSTPDLPLAVLGVAFVDLPLARAAPRYAAAIAWLASAIGLASQSLQAVAVTAIHVLVVSLLIIVASQRARRWIPSAATILTAGVLPLATPPVVEVSHLRFQMRSMITASSSPNPDVRTLGLPVVGGELRRA